MTDTTPAARRRVDVSGRPFHAAVLVACVALMLLGAFHANTWYDESYTVALVKKSFADIWRIDAADVHPPLYYLALKLVNLVAGSNVVAYRLFSVLGAAATATLGLTRVRRDLGWREGLAFTLVTALIPHVLYYATQVRMYSWVTFTVALCFLVALRIRELVRTGGRVPAREWATFALASLASAYLHYYGAMAAFLVNVALLGSLAALARRGEKGTGPDSATRDAAGTRRAAGNGPVAVAGPDADASQPQTPSAAGARHAIWVLLGLAVAQVLAYVPWMVALLGQMGHMVSKGYWIKFEMPLSLLQVIDAPILSNIGIMGLGDPWLLGARVSHWAIAALTVFGVAGCVVSARRDQRPAARWAGVWGVAVYVGIIVVAGVAGALVRTPILYYRYMAVGAGPLAAGLSVGWARLRRPQVQAVLVAALVALAVHEQAYTLPKAYSPANAGAGEALARLVSENGGTQATPVVTRDFTMMGELAVERPDVQQVYPNWFMGYWTGAYEAYEPPVMLSTDANSMSLGTSGKILFLAEDDSPAKARQEAEQFADALERKVGGPGWDVVAMESHTRPYDVRTYNFVTLQRRDG